MPHVVIECQARISDYQPLFRSIDFRQGTRIVKIKRFFLEKGGESALLEVIAVEAGHQQKFFIQLAQKPEGITVRLEPLTDPEKNTAVKTSLALVARHEVVVRPEPLARLLGAAGRSGRHRFFVVRDGVAFVIDDDLPLLIDKDHIFAGLLGFAYASRIIHRAADRVADELIDERFRLHRNARGNGVVARALVAPVGDRLHGAVE